MDFSAIHPSSDYSALSQVYLTIEVFFPKRIKLDNEKWQTNLKRASPGAAHNVLNTKRGEGEEKHIRNRKDFSAPSMTLN